MSGSETQSQRDIEAKISQVEPGTPRHQMLLAARDFRASWVEFGELLTELREKGLYEKWGYTNFETYCRRELRLRRDTALKLTRSYSFVREHQPQVLEMSAGEREMPALDVVDLLTRAQERSSISEPEFNTIKSEVFSAEGPATRNAVVKRFREFDPDAFRASPKAAENDDGTVPKMDVKKALLLAERLSVLLLGDEQTDDIAKGHLQNLVAKLKDRFETEKLKKSA